MKSISCFLVLFFTAIAIAENIDGDWEERYSALKLQVDALNDKLDQEQFKVSMLLKHVEQESLDKQEASRHLERKEIENSQLISMIEQLERKNSEKISNLDTQLNELKTQLVIKPHSGAFSNEIMFMASSRPTEVVHYPNDYITFEELELDNGGVFDKDTGTFTAPTEGKYLFYFISEVEDCPETFIRIYVNGKITQYFRHNNGAGYDGREINAFWWLNLQEGDEVRLFNEIEGCMYIKKYYPMYFMGYRVNEDGISKQ